MWLAADLRPVLSCGRVRGACLTAPWDWAQPDVGRGEFHILLLLV